ncbi:MAG: PPOX class F420-dependent oxidoreductase [Acidobacteria bacterium]|jgi:PPOX class probable F420-dependent enzyme|nr:PPOX class F420-dependent oxidoreductase [Acidobacteriota bacterium]
MSEVIPARFLELFQKKSFGHLATLLPNGTPQTSPVWVDFDDTYVLVNSARGRLKDKNMRQRPQVALSIQDPDDPYRYLEVRGRVVEITEQGAEEHIDRLAKRYLGLDRYPYRQPGEVRVIYKIKPERTSTQGS